MEPNWVVELRETNPALLEEIQNAINHSNSWMQKWIDKEIEHAKEMLLGYGYYVLSSDQKIDLVNDAIELYKQNNSYREVE